MSDSDSAKRLTNLEMKFAFIEEHIALQDREILKLRTQIEKQIADLERLKAEQDGDHLTIRGDERPPHY